MIIAEKLRTAVRAHRRAFVSLVVALSIVTWTAVGTSAWFIRDIVTGLPDEQSVRAIGTMAQSTTLLDRHGRPAFAIFKEQRLEVPLERVSPHLVRALVAIEDQRFYEHSGLDVIRIAGAALNNLREGRAEQGGSTLTQQLARQSLLTAERTYRRKLKEILVAARIESEFDKREILSLYLNKVYFGDGLHGVEAASLGYFGKHAAEVDVAEAALLAGLVKSPSAYAPTVNLDRAVARRNVVLQVMHDTAAIDRATYEQAVAQAVTLDDALRKDEPFGRYFKEEVRRQLVEKFGWERVYQGGLRVQTTIDLDMQKLAEAEVARGLEEIERRQSGGRGEGLTRTGEAAKEGMTLHGVERLQAALVALDPHTGEVLAMVGGRDFDESSFNRATQARRQPGSAFKPFVYAVALERGFSPGTLLTGLDQPVRTPQGLWVPEDGHSSETSMTMRAALRMSSNRAAVRMLQQIGIPPAVRYAERFGVGLVPSVPSLALGSGEVTLLSMSAAFATFANAGMAPVPTLIRRVETTDGELLFTGGSPARRVVSEATAFIMSSMLSDVIDAGTATGVRRAGFTLPAAGKTGTTNEYRDAWFVGYTPTLVTGVWVGYDMPRTIMRDGYAAELAVPMWGRFMRAATRGDKAEWFKAPRTVTSATICRLSGKLATDGCRHVTTVDSRGDATTGSMAYTEYFVRGSVPDDYCPLHGWHDGAGSQLASAIGAGETRTAPAATGGSAAESTAAAPQPASSAAADAPAGRDPAAVKSETSDDEAAAQAPGQRRGFWSRLFGRRGNPPPQAGPPPASEQSREPVGRD